MNILLVCTGNTCRSSMAEGLFKYILEENHKKDINISSAGIYAVEKSRANDKAIEVLKNQNIDISKHSARILSKELVENSDLILAMTILHKELIINFFPGNEEKIYTLKEFSALMNEEENETNFDINDPYGMNYDVYEQTMIEIKDSINKIVKNIDKL